MYRSLVYFHAKTNFRAKNRISMEIYFGFCDWYLIQIVLCYKISPRLILVKQSTKPKFFNTENKPDYGIMLSFPVSLFSFL